MKSKFKQSNNTKVRIRKYKLNWTERYARLVLWLFNVDEKDAFLKLAKRIDSHRTASGVKFTVQYLKECLRLIQHWKSGNPTVCLKDGPRIATRRGLPLLIPGQVRLRMEDNCTVTTKVVLTIISIFRVYKYEGVLKTSTITDPFTGSTNRLEFWELDRTWGLFKPFIPSKRMPGLDELLPLRTAGPNFKRSILGAPLDAWA